MDVPSARSRATDGQREAADPRVSAFVSASAGSGKTKLLTDRLLRLLLEGADPRRILCLTYTKAAAAEMALRLRAALATFATGSDAELSEALGRLGLAGTAAERGRARELFARVLDLPGGMRIETIHAFCQSLLRRFPLEADVSPHFRLLADADATAALQDAQETVLSDVDVGTTPSARRMAERDAIALVAGTVDLGAFFKLARTLADDRDRLGALLRRDSFEVAGAIREALGATRDEAAILDEAVAQVDEAELVAALRTIAARSTAKKAVADALTRLDFLAEPPARRRSNWARYARTFLTEEGEARALSTLTGPKLLKDRPDVGSAMGEELGRVLAVLESQKAWRAARLSAALLALALPMAKRYARGKAGTARLDYGDLIDGTTGLLADPGAAWVLHKLDGGLDHLLLDEVQDTSPAQWAIAGALVREFFSGEGARDTTRTVFAVGDRKQSIFSFQGAEPAAFDLWRERLRGLAVGAGQHWRDVGLDVSFRSTVPVLAMVDAVFADPLAAKGVVEHGVLRHESDRVGQAGSVELWPLEPRLPKTPPPVWDAPHRRESAKGAPQRLAESVADWILGAVSGGVELPSRGRAARPGDVLVLVRRRDDLVRAIVRALKHKGVPVAGLDRMTLTTQAAVADLLALCDALLLPRDDLAVACVLTSPLGGLDDDDLIALAPRRDGSLWDELRRRAAERPRWAEAWSMLSALFARVDFSSPHALLSEALGPLRGRAKLLARLGPEAAEPIDELLAAAHAYGHDHPPSLQGFVHWLRRSAAEVKRQPEAAGGLVRLMTVHGAKGLQAPIVILPDTTAVPPAHDSLLWAGQAGAEVPIWAPGDEWRSRAVEALREAAGIRAAEEHNRLLYVALTRAEDRLIVCGYETHHKLREECWYRVVARGFLALESERVETTTGTLLRHSSPQTADPDRPDARVTTERTMALPIWAGTAPDWRPAPPPNSDSSPLRLAPSRPAGVELGVVPASASPLARTARFERGRLLHGLLQHLPDLPQAARIDAARRFLARAGLPEAEQEATLSELLAVLANPALAEAFGPGSRAEVPLTGLVAGQVVGGLVDRLAVRPDVVLVVDYKTNRRPPDAVARTPVAYLRQMAAYRAVVAAVYPGRLIRCVLVWTVGPVVMDVPPALLDRFAPGAGPVA